MYAQPCESLADLTWLVGTWIAPQEHGAVREEWWAVSPRTFEGLGVTVGGEAEGTPAIVETLRLVEMSGAVYYVAKVGHNALPVAFHAEACSPDGAVFVNRAHDFPQRLEYRRGAEGLTVTVSADAGRGFTLQFERDRSPIR